MKNILSLLLLLNVILAFGQEFQCIKETQLTYAEQQAILMVYQDYINELKSENKIIHIQYDFAKNKDSMTFIVYADIFSPGILELPADCFADDSTNIIQLYTPNHTLATDTLWLQEIYEKARHKGMPTEIINWSERIYNDYGDIWRFNPPVYYYLVVMDKIIKKKKTHNLMLFYYQIYESFPLND